MVPDPPGLFDGHVWPIYFTHMKEMEDGSVDVVYLDGLSAVVGLASFINAICAVSRGNRTEVCLHEVL